MPNATKLTLSVPRPVVAKARRISKKRGESVSAMFSRFVDAVSGEDFPEESYPPKTLRTLQLALDAPPVPADMDWRAVRDEVLAERYAP